MWLSMRDDMIRSTFGLIAAFTLLACQAPLVRCGEPAVQGRNGMVVSVSAPASEVGVQILKQGGNAVDSAVATAFALAVTYPIAGNIGGGGFMVIHPPKAKPVVVEYRETA